MAASFPLFPSVFPAILAAWKKKSPPPARGRRKAEGPSASQGVLVRPASDDMPAITSPASRFREFRERAALSHDQAAGQMGISSPSVWDIESYEDELSSCYSLSELRRFARVLNVRPWDLFGVETSESPVSATELVHLIHEQCRSRGVSLEQFEEVVGWRLSACIEPPEHLLQDLSIDGLQWLCRELGINWHRVLLSL